MTRSYHDAIPLPGLPLWRSAGARRIPFSLDLEITARCNNNCRHCYINLPAADRAARAKELTLEEIREITDEAVSLGALWCLVTGGEPLLREDFFSIYLHLKRKGLLVSVFTSATLVTEEHVRLFQKYPPRDIEVSVYGATRETYERVTRTPGSFDSFVRGLDLLGEGGVKVRLKSMALRSNLHEFPEIARFCRERTKGHFRFDPLLHLRLEGDRARNEEIKAERLSPEEIAAVERMDPGRLHALKSDCGALMDHGTAPACDRLIQCGAGESSFSVSYDGSFRLCASLVRPDCVYDLRRGRLGEAWGRFVPEVRGLRSGNRESLAKCRACPVGSLCAWCPAHAHLETGRMDVAVDYYCRAAHARAAAVAAGNSCA